MIPIKHIGKALAFFTVAFLLCSCASYNQQASDFYSSLAQGDYEKASKRLDHNKLLKKKRNRLLYLLEKGRVEHLLQNFEKSNVYLNEADQLMEDAKTSAGDLVAGNLLNPMMQSYRGEDFEKYMVHYYKALNYLQLNETEEALVEARRISLRTFAQDDRVNGDRYTQDAFSFILQGLIYEKAGDINNAFIAYRNGVNLYLDNNNTYYGTRMPLQLKKDLLRMAHLNGFADEFERYRQIFQIDLDRNEIEAEGELVLFWENGLAPVKREQNLFFSLSKNGNGSYFFSDAGGFYNVPFDYASHSQNEASLASAHSFRVAIPRYEQQKPLFSAATVTLDNSTIQLEPAQNINELALATLRERRLKDLSKTLTRLAIKKLAEEAAKPKADEKDKKKKNNQEALAMGLKLFNMASEKADTRNWQSLPHSIHYTRIPLKKGLNQLTIDLARDHGPVNKKELTISSPGGLQFQNITTL